ncbi:MAG: aldehyde dehydrogenase family protein [Gracilimonas sp.]|uniref:aldehyde dehydrogenase family protein n=1 Tax=Gracilimonas TaxID=649462 RepID=UPI001B13C38B|nr:aldehyde dehydrogenase family protein [Gracilimonas sp.]MBO6586130.1 aldehyde dehydrogenase family protein [Gracilimonas sp.]MBO6614787.1 aldehyde dehydrogenase family protein [Gracilimonas sp.]
MSDTETKEAPYKPTSPNSKLDFESVWEYAPAPQTSDFVEVKERYDLFIGGKFVKPSKGRYFKSTNPATEEEITEFAEATQKDVDKAVKAARKAFEGEWSRISAKERGKYIYRIARMIQERAREFAVLESMDGGKPIRESRDVDIPLVAAYFFYYAGWADKLEYAFPGRKPKPLGVCGQIIPWNFPLLMLAWKIAPALACGNTVVLKPAETTSLTALKFAELVRDCGLPDGVVNIVTGAGQTGAEIVNHKDIDKVAFTGSTQVGKIIQKSLAGTDKKYTLELGGKGALVIFEDAPIDQAVEGIINAIYFNQGHVCCAGSRLLVQEGVADKVIQKLKDRLETLIVGDPLDKNTDIGAINSKEQFETVNKYLELGVDEGADIYQSKCEIPENGYFIRPTLFTNVSQSNRVVQEEIFGPVLTVQTFRTADEGIDKANNTPYGLASGVWTDKGSKIFQMGSKMRSGVIWANTYNKFDPTSPFGGYKESGVGREGGLHGLAAYTKI